jgi:PAS domain S-box-containing protein
MFTKLFLEQNNPSFKVNSIPSPKKALEELENNSYDCLISDYNMPEMNGLELARKIRKKNQIPIVLYTGEGSEEVAEQAFSVGIDSYIRKEIHPSNYQVLGKTIKNVVERHRANLLLMESERRFRKLVEDSPVPISVTIGDKIVYVNQRRAELTSKDSPDSLIGSSGLEGVHPEDRERVIARVSARARGEKVSPINVFRLRCVDGTIIHVEDHMSDTVWEGEPAVLHSLLDLTERLMYEEQLQAMHRYGAMLSRAEDILSVARTTLDAIESLMGFSSASFGVVEGDGVNFIHALGLDPFVNRFYKLSGLGISVRAILTQETQVVKDTRLDPDYISYYADELNRVHLSEVDVPVIIEDEAVAVINMEQKDVDAFTCREVSLLKLLAVHVASSLERLRREDKLREYTRKLEALHRCSTRLATAKTREEVYDVVLEIMKDDLEYTWVGIAKVEEGYLRYIRANSLGYQDYALSLDGPGVTVRTVKTGATQLVRDTRDESNYIVLKENVKPNLSELAVPVIIKDRIYLVLNLESEIVDAFKKEDVRLIELLARHVASTLENIAALEELEVHEMRLRALNRFGADVERCSSFEEIASLTMDSVESIFNYTTGSFGVIENGEIRFIEFRRPTTTPVISIHQKGITARAVRNKKTQLVPDVRLDPDYVNGRVKGETTLSELDVPVLLDGDPVALINLESEILGFFGKTDADLVEIMAEHVASSLWKINAIKNSEAYRGRSSF